MGKVPGGREIDPWTIHPSKAGKITKKACVRTQTYLKNSKNTIVNLYSLLMHARWQPWVKALCQPLRDDFRVGNV